jgi:hypothetical protein
MEQRTATAARWSSDGRCSADERCSLVAVALTAMAAQGWLFHSALLCPLVRDVSVWVRCWGLGEGGGRRHEMVGHMRLLDLVQCPAEAFIYVELQVSLSHAQMVWCSGSILILIMTCQFSVLIINILVADYNI